MRLEAERDFLACDYCRSIYFPEPNSDGVRVLGESMELACPVCAIKLAEAAVASRRILYCTRCRGMLLPMNLFVAIIQELRSHKDTSADTMRQPDWNGLNRKIRCPQCGETMNTHAYGGPGNIIIDDCERCSLDWLDYGELDKIVRAPDHAYTGHAWDPA
jgi:Zn-finger nucleic acid-binding protein